MALPAKLSELCRSKFFSVVADIAAKPLFWQVNAGNANTSSSTTTTTKKKSSKSASMGPESGALEALWGLHETWQSLEQGGRKFAKDVTVGLDEREACSVALGVVRRIRAGAARCELQYILIVTSIHYTLSTVLPHVTVSRNAPFSWANQAHMLRVELYIYVGVHRAGRVQLYINASTTGKPFWENDLLEIRAERSFRALKGFKVEDAA